jgi:hypothetical protein
LLADGQWFYQQKIPINYYNNELNSDKCSKKFLIKELGLWVFKYTFVASFIGGEKERKIKPLTIC